MLRLLPLLLLMMILVLTGCDSGTESKKREEQSSTTAAVEDQSGTREAGDEPVGETSRMTAAGTAVVATVNGVPVSREMFEAQVAMAVAERASYGLNIDDADQGAEQEATLRLEVLNNIISLELACEEALRRGFGPADDDLETTVAAIRKEYETPEALQALLAQHGDTEDDLRRQLSKTMALKKWQEDGFLAEIKVGPEEARDFYDQHQQMLSRGESVRVSQIAVKVPLLAQPDQKAKLKRKADLIEQLIKAGEDFNYLAAEMSDEDEAKENLGDMGWVEKGQVLGVFEAAIFSLKPGQVSELVESPMGYHFFKVFETRPAGVEPYSEARGRIVEYLSNLKLEQAFREKMVELYAKADIQILDPELKRIHGELMGENN